MNNLNTIFDNIFIIDTGKNDNIEFQIKQSNLLFEIVKLIKLPQNDDIFNIIKSYERTNIESVEEFNLMKNEKLNTFIENIPDDFDILQINYKIPKSLNLENVFNDLYLNDIYFIISEYDLKPINGIGLSKNGIQYLLDYFEYNIQNIKIPISQNSINFKKTNIKHYISTIPLTYVNDNKDDYNILK